MLLPLMSFERDFVYSTIAATPINLQAHRKTYPYTRSVC
jgi:hypothetical protein